MTPALASILTGVNAMWSPPPDLTVSQWADEYRRLSPEASAEPGRWNTDRAPYQRGIMDAFTEPDIHTVVVMASAQTGKSELLLNIIGYFAHQDPSPMLMLQPTLDMAEGFSKDRIAPMVRDTPALSELIADSRSRDSGNTLLHKKFPGGHITLAGANSPASLASRPVRVVLCDEVDRYPVSAGAEGDPVSLAVARTKTFWNRKIMLTSTPTVANCSRIEKAWLESDQRKYFVPCPHCGERQTFEWERITYEDNKPETAVFACIGCGALIEETEKLSMLRAGEWQATATSRGIAGFHLNELYSPWRAWGEVVSDFLRTTGRPELYKTWLNTSMGLPWEDRDGELLSADSLQARREAWRENLLPAEVVLLTAGVDVQNDRLEGVLLGWANNGQCLVVSRRVFEGPPAFRQVWQTLDEWLLHSRPTETGGALSVAGTCIDSGGHNTQAVYEFCAERAGRNVYAIKGVGGPKPIWPDRSSTSKKHRGWRLWTIGVDTIKDALRARLSLTEGPGRVRFSADLSPEFFSQLTVERRVITYDRRGRPVRNWVKPSGARNESWDCTVYGMAALEALKRLRRIDVSKIAPPVPASAEPKPEQRRERTVVKRSFGRG